MIEWEWEGTDNTSAAALINHLLPSVLVAQHRSTSVDRHQAIEVLYGSFVPLSIVVLVKSSPPTYYSEAIQN